MGGLDARLTVRLEKTLIAEVEKKLNEIRKLHFVGSEILETAPMSSNLSTVVLNPRPL